MSELKRAILVTGASGCLGAWVVRDLLRQGRPVICFDLKENRRRLRLVLDEAVAEQLPWVAGDVSDAAAVAAAVDRHRIDAIVHLAALQVPFCRAAPVSGAQVNVGGLVNVLEAGRLQGVSRIVYASSIAALPSDTPTGGFTTLYGAFKAADEAIASAYWHEFKVPSIGLRPAPIFGVGRDQGMTSLPTLAMLAAVIGCPFTIPFGGQLVFQHAEDVARVFTLCLELEGDGAQIYNLGGDPIAVADIVAIIRETVPAAAIDSIGDGLPFSSAIDDAPLRRRIGTWQPAEIGKRIQETIAAFRMLHDRGLLDAADIKVSATGVRAS